MADAMRVSGMAARAADALLRGTGGRTVLLRLPASAVAGDAGEQLGLAVPEFQDVELAPVLVRGVTGSKDSETRELLVSVTAVSGLLGSLGYAAANVLFANAFGVMVDGVLLEVVSFSERQVAGEPYVYLVVARVPRMYEI